MSSSRRAEDDPFVSGPAFFVEPTQISNHD